MLRGRGFVTRLQLISHPTTPMPQVRALDVALSRSGDGGLVAIYECDCAAGVLRLPDARSAEAADGLWRHTCCELFVGVAGDAAYREYNFSPSGQWAMYRFSAYRVRDSSNPDVAGPAPHIEFASGETAWRLEARLDAAVLPSRAGEQIELGVAVVLEAANGDLSYWALRHAAGQPDFHHRESFVVRLGDLA